jgi:hypothetical protein
MSTVNVNRVVDASGGVLAPISSVMRNRLINGQMVLDQRNAGASVSTSSGILVYFVDRFFGLYSQTNKFTAQQNAGSVTPPAGFRNYLGITSSSAYTVSASEQFAVAQVIEGYNVADLGWGTANAKTVTLSFQVYSSLTGTFGGSLRNSSGTRSYPFSYSVPVANTWTNISITIAGDTTGTWLVTNGPGILCYWGLGVGSTLSGTAGAWAGSNFVSATGATSVVGTNGATFYITGVQFEVGTQATSFEYRQYTTELQLCQRYCVNFQSAGGFTRFGIVDCKTNDNVDLVILFPVVMRASPTLTTRTASEYTIFSRNSLFTCSGVSLNQASTFAATVSSNPSSTTLTTGSVGQLLANDNSTANLLFTAEL